ncbi:hypothetical protein [Sphingobium sp.]|uniref:hypothetical protein n=1 Tax=Sphingobium sp. TaxID=1912891 RepID=UPI002C47F364|nr:hypothetical protein [Sphingobium sp.]HUD91899.1 hypothetical protein [Sphingobium sp.]
MKSHRIEIDRATADRAAAGRTAFIAHEVREYCRKSGLPLDYFDGCAPCEQGAVLVLEIVRYSREEIERIGPGQTDWERVRNMTDEEIEAAAASEPDAEPVGLDWSNIGLGSPKG